MNSGRVFVALIYASHSSLRISLLTTRFPSQHHLRHHHRHTARDDAQKGRGYALTSSFNFLFVVTSPVEGVGAFLFLVEESMIAYNFEEGLQTEKTVGRIARTQANKSGQENGQYQYPTPL